MRPPARRRWRAAAHPATGRRARRTASRHETPRRADTARRSSPRRPRARAAPPSSTTRCDRYTASWIECVTNTTVSCCSRHSASRSASSLWRVISSSAPNGSSISSSVGRVTRLRAIDTRICMPPDSSRGRCAAKARSPTSAQGVARARIGVAARHLRQVERQPHVGLHARPRHQRGFLEHECDALAAVVDATDRLAADQQTAVGGFEQPGHHFQQRALAAARRPEQRDELAGMHREVDRQQRLRAVGVRLRHAEDLDGRCHRALTRRVPRSCAGTSPPGAGRP